VLQNAGPFRRMAFDADAQATYNDVVSLVYSYRTDGDRLSDYIPEGFELSKPELLIQYQQCRQVDWMAGSYYNLITVAAPVRFNGRSDQLDGVFALVVWENKTTPILTGQQMGVPKIYADIEDLHIVAETYRTRASYEGSTFLRLDMTQPKLMDKEHVAALSMEVNSFGWRYVPRVGAPGAELSQPILFPMRSEAQSAWVGRGAVQWTELKWEENPMQWHIIKALAGLPMIEMAPAMLTKGRAILMESRDVVLK